MKGLPPAKNVGTNVKEKLHELLIEIEMGDNQKRVASTHVTISKKEVNSMEKFPKGLITKTNQRGRPIFESTLGEAPPAKSATATGEGTGEDRCFQGRL